MPQISLDVDTKTLNKIEKAAELRNTSISKWVTGKLAEHLAHISQVPGIIFYDCG